MRRPLSKKIQIPEGVELKIEGSKVKVKGPEGEIEREFNFGKVKAQVKEKEVILSNEKSTKNEKKMMNTVSAHITNMVKGAQKKFEYHLKICFGHFPFTVKQEGNSVLIKNFLGEKVERRVNIPENVDVEIKKEMILVKSMNKELVGQASANFEIATKIRGRDKRIFQDGIYIIEKDGKKI